MPFDELFDVDETNLELGPSLDVRLLTATVDGPTWDAQHAEDRLLGELRAWARRRGFDRRQQRALSEALLHAFDRMPELADQA